MKQLLTTCVVCALAACSPQDHSPQSHDPDRVAGESASTSASAPGSITPAAVDVPAGAYTLDKAHASLLFRVNHLGFSHYTRRFRHFDAQLQFDPANPAASSVTATIDARSIETDYPDPALDFNAQLQGEQWLNTARYPEMTFRSTRVELTGPNTMRIDGELNLRGVTRPMALDATFNGGYAGHPMDPHARIGFSAHGTLKRSDFGMGFGIPTAANPLGVSDEVDVIIEAEFNGPAWAGAPADQSTAPHE